MTRQDRVPVLVTGGAGYIGSHAVLALLDAGWPVVVIDDLSTGFEWAVPEGAVFARGDIADQPLVARLIGEHRIDRFHPDLAARNLLPEVQSGDGYALTVPRLAAHRFTAGEESGREQRRERDRRFFHHLLSSSPNETV